MVRLPRPAANPKARVSVDRAAMAIPETRAEETLTPVAGAQETLVVVIPTQAEATSVVVIQTSSKNYLRV